MKIRFLIIGLLLSVLGYGQVAMMSGGSGGSDFVFAGDSANWEQEFKDYYYTITETERPRADTADLQNDLFRSMIDSSLWTGRIDLFYLMAQKTEAGALLNAFNPSAGTYDLTDPSSTDPQFDSYEGFTGDGTSDFLSTNYNPSTDNTYFVQDDATIAVYTRLSGTNGDIMGANGPSHDTYFIYLSGTTMYSRVNNTQFITATTDSDGFFISSRTGSNVLDLYRDGSSISATMTGASTGLPNLDLYVLAVNDNDFTANQISIIIVMDGVSDTEAAAINTIIETYMDAIGNGVQ